MRPLVILPTYNERENLRPLAGRILDLRDDISVLVVDDNSPDGTGRMADELSAVEPRVSVLHRTAKEGLGAAYCAGFAEALAGGYDPIVTMDCDFSHDPAYIPALIDAVGDAGMAIGSRYVRGGGVRRWGVHRKVLSRCANIFARKMLGLRSHDCTSGFRSFRRSTLEGLGIEDIVSNGYSFQVEVLYRCERAGVRVVEVPIIFIDRRMGRSKMSKNEIIGGIFSVLQVRRRTGL